MTGVVPGPQTVSDDGWFVALDGDQRGPMTASEVWRLIFQTTSGASIQVWHPSLPEWQQLPPGKSSLSTPALAILRSSEFQLRNSKYITWVFCCLMPFFLICIALTREFQDSSVVIFVIFMLFCFSWWVYLEYKGINLQNTDLSLPFRSPIWPYPPLWIQRIRLSDVSGFECWSRGNSTHQFKIHSAGRSSLVLLDSLLHKEMLVIALEQRVPQTQPS